jgi:Mce-associated membrane protein
VEASSAQVPADVDAAVEDGSKANTDNDESVSSNGEDEKECQGRAGGEVTTNTARRWTRRAKAAPDDEDGPPAVPRRWIRLAIRCASAVAVIAVLAGAGYEGWLLIQQHQKDIAAQQALDAAKNYAVTLTTTDPQAIDQNFTDILNGATGNFKDTYAKASSRLRKALIDNKVATQGTVVDAAIKSASKNNVVVLLFVEQSVTNADAPDPRTDLTAVTITMEKVGDRWLASEVVLPGASG